MQSELVRATGAVMNFIGALNEALLKAGGNPAMIYFAQAKHARPMMDLLAKTIVESKLWKIPASLIIDEVINDHDDPEYLEFDKKWKWHVFSRTARELTTHRFASESKIRDYDDATVGIPPEILIQLPASTNSPGPKMITWEGNSYVVTFWKEPSDAVFLAPAEWFDLEN